MIRGVIRDGIIQPIEPLPVHWQEGHEVIVDTPHAPSKNGDDSLDRWLADMMDLTKELQDEDEWMEIEAILAEADREAKATVRREMRLS